MEIERLKDMPDGVLANILTCIEMPVDLDVTPRTQVTRNIGAFHMLAHLVEGDWQQSSHKEIGEFLSRVVANATRQGVAVEMVAHAQIEPHSTDVITEGEDLTRHSTRVRHWADGGPSPLVASTVTSEHQPGEPEVQGPNSVPTGSRYDTSTENYADGSPNIPEPQWLQDEGIRMTRERGE